ncbi:MAG: hypothetical protein AAF557_14060 [Pseudomonadota bacterium]
MIPKSPITALTGERLPGIGHNQGPPLDTGHSWRKHVWTRARKQLLPRLPLEVIRRRVARAKELGLEYPAYASILLGTGRDIVGFLFTCDALGLRLEKSIDLPAPVAAKLSEVKARHLLAADQPADLNHVARHLAIEHHLAIAGTTALPDPATAPWTAGRAAIRAALDPLKLPSDTIVMVGTRAHERDWADAARLAKFLPAESYFPGHR